MTSTRRALLTSLFIALVVAGGQALAAVPNVEVVTFLVFVAGFLLGPRLGALVGGVGMGAHSMFNVMGAAMVPVLAVQVASYAAVGFAGGVVGPWLATRLGRIAGAAVACLAGAALVLGYQLLVNIATFYVFTNDATLWAYIWGGVVFSAIQILWNAGLFLVAMRPTLMVLERYRAELGTA